MNAIKRASLSISSVIHDAYWRANRSNYHDDRQDYEVVCIGPLPGPLDLIFDAPSGNQTIISIH